ncbi:tetratricopeptide repeat protein [Oceanobacillus chungangensis]|uniref:Uncharacterized protein n=1 Tax=Oceanobacillus chungangensis TaxID=1229152 RepID=A0A3D8Q1Y3_9BACI|nr:tetratricopeptide repeat protein [Oceanobacillus chungangensis]RDW22052.1 hypothetical protein CWR45_00755 [Oceanobacillus chungangensis]
MDTIMEAVQLIENNEAEKALKLLKQHLEMASDDEKFTIAQLYLQLGFLQEAKELLTELLKIYPDESELKLTISEVFIELEDDESAINLLVGIKKDDEFYVQALLQLADLYQAQGLFEVAEQKLLIAKQLEPSEEIIDFALAELYFSIGEYKKAILYYEKIDQEKIVAVSIDDRLGEAYAAAGEYEKALNYFKEHENEDPERLFRYGITAYQADRNDIAIKAWEHVIELDPYYHTVYYQLARAYEEEGRPEEGYAISKKGIQIDAFNKELFLQAATFAHQFGENEQSEEFARNAVVLDTDYKEAVLFLIELFKNQTNYHAIIDLLLEIKKTDAEDALYEWELARAYNEIDSYDHALKHYQEAYNTLSQDSDFVKEYGYFLTEEGRIGEAIPIFESYLLLQPLDVEVEEFVNRLKLSRNDD